MFETLRADSMELLGERNPATMDVTNDLAILVGSMGEPKIGRELLERLVPMRTAVLGAEHPNTLGDHALAIASYRELLELREGALSKNDVRTVDAVWQLEVQLRGLGNQEDADAVRARYVSPLLDATSGMLSYQQLDKAEGIRRTEREEARAAHTAA